jgi:adenylate kinase
MGRLEDELKRIRQTMDSFESRIKTLEERALGGVSAKPAEEVRMLLIGPPGAGGFFFRGVNSGTATNGV